MYITQQSFAFAVEFFRRLAIFEILVPAADFVGIVSVENDLAVRVVFDVFRDEIVTYAGPHGCRIVAFHGEYHLFDGVEELFLR